MDSFEEDRLFVISDIHIGNPAFQNKDGILGFLDFVHAEGVSLVINGDGLDFLQPSINKFISVLPEVFQKVFRISQKSTIYYVIGNHDIYIEHFLFDIDTFKVVPFLNIRSGAKNIRIEHAHVYDDLYIRYPNAYFSICRWMGLFLKFFPALYPTYGFFEKVMGTFRVIRNVSENSNDEKPVFKNAASLILERGFDAVIFGHTHRFGKLEISPDKYYYNTGSWFNDPHYIQIKNGEIKLKEFENVTP